MIDFIKIGRMYWIKPKPTPGMPSKDRTGIVLEKYGKGKTIFLHIGSSKYPETSSLKATHLVIDALGTENFLMNNQNIKSYIHLDASKPEWNTSIIKPHIYQAKYVEMPMKCMKNLRVLYHYRRKELEAIRIKKAKFAILNHNSLAALKQIKMMKDKDPIKHSKLNPENFVKKLKLKIL